MPSRYREQYERTKRYFQRLTDIKNGIGHIKDSRSYEDDLYAFFQNCYHLKDWIRSDPTCNGWSSVEDYINSTRYLLICADLCNATKHLRLDRPRSAENPEFSGGNVVLKITDGLKQQEKIEISIDYKISTQSGDLDALEVATQCMQAWEAFLRTNGAAP
jgi:hypothetical protein